MLGPHLIGSISEHFDRLQRWQPRLILILDPSRDQVRELRQRCPNSFIIGRVYRPDSEVDQRIRANPRDAARWAHEAIMDRFAPEVNAWPVENEVLQQWDGLPLLNEFALERMRVADAQGYKAAILAFSVGNPDLPEHDRMALWRQVYPALAYAEQHNHVVVVHQYGSPSLWQPDANWYIHRLEHQVLPQLPYQVKFACTEFGIDNLINGHHPGPSGYKNSTTAQQYAADLINIGHYLERYKDRVIGYAIFTLGHNAPWDSYDINGEVADKLADHYRSTPQPAPIPAAPPVIQPAAPPVIQPVVPPAVQPLHPLPAFRQREVVQAAVYCRVRTAPGFAGSPVGLFTPEFAVYVVDGPQEQDNLVWWKVGGVSSDGTRVLGWTAQRDPEGTVLLRKAEGVLRNRLQPPFDGTYAITQFFGENPNAYVAFQLRGHNGLDLGLPEGVPVKAVDQGWGFQVQDDPSGYGQFVKLRHTWGESLYAHLSRVAIAEGQQAAQGQIIGYSGNTGNSTGPHLHFAVRVDPYNLDDGWKGYSDPLPWLPGVCYRLPLEGSVQPQPVQPQPIQPEPLQVQRRLSQAFAQMGLEIQPQIPAANGEVVYVVKDVFTTHDGSWEVGQKPPPYGIEQWARDSYLKPWGAPDYFDDAGAATHLLGTVIGLDGQLMRNYPIRWWTKDNQNHFVTPTKEKSGWANMPMSASSAFWPNNAQAGPWCWAPEGAAEYISGSGLPNQWHVSTFVVWQAVRRP